MTGPTAPVPAGSGQEYTYNVTQEGAYVPGATTSAQNSYDPASYNQWDPKNPETLYPAPGPEPAPAMGPCDQRTGRGYWCPKNWYVDQKVRIMYHPTARGRIYSQLYDPYLDVVGRTALFRYEGKSGSLKMEPSAGYDITIGKYLGRDADNRDQFIEFTYYGLNNWSSAFPVHATNSSLELSNETETETATITTTSGNLFSPFGGSNSAFSNVSGFNRVDTHELEYHSRWDNFELNLRIKPRRQADRLIMHKNAMWTREAQEGWYCSYLLGARGVSLDEYFSFLSSGTIDVVRTAAPDYTADVGGQYITRTRNDLFGLQLGMDCMHQKGPWRFGADVKAGVFINFADQHTRARSWGAYGGDAASTGDPWATTDVDFQTLVRSRDLASIAELGFSTSYQLRRNMTFNLAYDLSWVHGVALAPEQFIPIANAPARINHNGAIMMQSLSMGLELVW
ncbi:MAG: BBP7 family outer membrane beta-barrel protein [Planctomycetia bacterium]